MNNKYALYKMEANKYVGDCISIVCHLDKIPAGFTGRDVTVIVKTEKSAWCKINSLDDFMNANLFGSQVPYLRIGSECMLGVMGDSHCNCEEERIEALTVIGSHCGAYIHMPQEAQGMGLFYKAKELHLQVHGYMPNGKYIGCKSQVEAARILTENKIIDSRDYDVVAEIMSDLGLGGYGYHFMSRNPNKVKSLKNAGIEVVSMYDIATHMNENNIGEYLTKWIDKGYCFTNDEVTQLLKLLTEDKVLPKRASDLLGKAAEMIGTDEGKHYLQKHMYTTPEIREQLFNSIVNTFYVEKAV